MSVKTQLAEALNLHKELWRLRQILLHSVEGLQQVNHELSVGGPVMDTIVGKVDGAAMNEACLSIYAAAHQLMVHAGSVEKQIAGMICKRGTSSENEEPPAKKQRGCEKTEETPEETG